MDIKMGVKIKELKKLNELRDKYFKLLDSTPYDVASFDKRRQWLNALSILNDRIGTIENFIIFKGGVA